MKVRITTARGGDVPFLKSCAQQAYQPYVERIGREPAPMVADFETAVSAKQVYLLLCDNEPAGYVHCYPRNGHFHLENIALLPQSQGKGLSKHLFQHVEALAQQEGLTAIELYTNETMYENLALYTRLGFSETGRRHEDGFSRVYFRKRMSDSTTADF